MTRIPVLNLVEDVLSEEQEQADLLYKCDQNLHQYPLLKWLYHVPNGGWRGQRAGLRLKRAGVKPGVPDLQLDIGRGGYLGLRLEMKKSNASPSDVSPEQRAWHTFLREQGYCVAVCKGCKVAWTILTWYLSLRPTRVVSDAETTPPPAPLVLVSMRKAA